MGITTTDYGILECDAVWSVGTNLSLGVMCCLHLEGTSCTRRKQIRFLKNSGMSITL